MTKTPEYSAWSAMKARCYNKNSPRYYTHGARSITVCNEWINSFERFFQDMGKRPSPKHSLDRINNNGNYESSNCRWATPKEQCSNRRTNIWVEYQGEQVNIAKWANDRGWNKYVIKTRLKNYGWSIERALNTPVKKHIRKIKVLNKYGEI